MDFQIQFDASQHVGERCYKHTDGVTYCISDDGQYATASATDPEVVEANIANEIVVDGNVYPVITASFMRNENIKVVNLSSNITRLGTQAFENCKLDCLTIPASVKDIHCYAFYNCEVKKLVVNGCRGVDLSSFRSVENLYYDTFDTLMNVGKRPNAANLYIGGEKVNVLVVPEGVTELPESFVAWCESLEEVVLPSTLKKINDYAFQNCTNLKKANLPEGLEKIGSYSFAETAISEVTFPSSLTLINSGAYCKTKIENVDIPEGVEIGNSVFSSCYDLKSVKLPQSLTVLRSYLFDCCISLAEIAIPEAVTAIQKEAFYGCKLTSLELPAGLKTIGDEAFAFLPITEITIPASVTQIGEFVFEGCENLATVRSLIENPAECEVAAFEYPARRGGQRGFSDGVHYVFGKEVFYKQATLYVPNVKGMVAAYKKKAAWKKFSSIVLGE